MKPLYLNYCKQTFDENGALSRFELEYPACFNFSNDIVDVIAEQEPDRTALIWCDHKGNERIFSFSDLKDLSCRAANYLTAKGIQRGDRVLVILKRHFEYWYTVLALHRMGAVAIPASFMLSTEDIAYRIRTAHIKAVICCEDEDVALNTRAAAGSCKLFNVRIDRPGFERLDIGLKSESSDFPRVPTKATDPFLIYFTSGTTGFPKAVVHNYTYPLSHIMTAKYWQNVQDGGVHMSVADTGWGKASWGKIYGQWLCGSAVLAYDYHNFNPADMMDVVARYHVCTFCAPPTFYRFLVKSGLDNYNFSTLRYVTTAGEALNPDIFEIFYQHTGLEIKEGYGQTETTMLIGNLFDTASRPGSMGRPSPMYDLRIVDEDLCDVQTGEAGEIVVVPRTYGLMDCYDKDTEATDIAFRGGVYHTCDTAYRDKDGFIWYVGRTDDIIKSCGYRISPFEVESVLVKHPAVFECAVTGVPDAERGFAVKATVVLQKGYEGSPALVRQMQKFVKQQTAAYKYPRVIEFVKELPKTSSGKIRRVEIRNRDKQ